MNTLLLIPIIIFLWCFMAYVLRWDRVEAVIWTTLSILAIGVTFYFGGLI